MRVIVIFSHIFFLKQAEFKLDLHMLTMAFANDKLFTLAYIPDTLCAYRFHDLILTMLFLTS